MLRKYHPLLYFILFTKCYSQTAILDLALKHPDPAIQKVLRNKEKHEIQILLTKIKRTPSIQNLVKYSKPNEKLSKKEETNQ